ncbi:MAG: hypothetical protein AB2605_17195 [Candidatus Thiodiazotropha sp.]
MKNLSNCLLGLVLSLLLLQGCGGGGGGDGDGSGITGDTTYTGQTSAAIIDSTNAKDIASGLASGAQQAVVSDLLSESGIDASDEVCDAGGRADANTNADETEGTITFTNCAMSDMQGGTIVLDGIVEFSVNTGADTLSMDFNVTVSYLGESETINLTLACSNISTASLSCSIRSDFAGIDGRVYRIDDITVSGSEASGYYVSMTLYDPDHGRVDVTTSQPLTYDCANGVPGSGMLTLNGGSGTFALVSFDSCSSYTVTVDGVGTSYDW